MLEFILVVVYIVLTTAIGWYMSQRAKAQNDIKSFFIGKKELGTLLIMFVMFGEMVAGSSTVGSAQTAFKSGMSSVWTNWGQALGVFVFVATVSKLYRVAGHYGAYSVPEAFQFRFDSKPCRMVVMVIVVVVYGILYAMQPKAAGAILAPMLNIDLTAMTWIMGIIFIIQGLVGLKGIAAMNVVHASVLYVGSVVVGILAWHNVGSLDVVRETLGANYLSVTQPSLGAVIGNAAGGMFAFILSTSLVANVYSAKSKKVANRGVILAAVLVIIFAFFPALIGVFGKIMYPDAEAATIFYTVADTFGPAVGALASMAIIAAVFSTAPAFLLTISTTLTRDLYVALINKDATDKQQLRFSKIAGRVRPHRYLPRHLRTLHPLPGQRCVPDPRGCRYGPHHRRLLEEGRQEVRVLGNARRRSRRCRVALRRPALRHRSVLARLRHRPYRSRRSDSLQRQEGFRRLRTLQVQNGCCSCRGTLIHTQYAFTDPAVIPSDRYP